MPALPPVPGVLRVQLTWGTGNSKVNLTNLHFAYTAGPPTAANCATMAASVVSAAATNLTSLMASAASMGEATVTDLATTSGHQGTGGSPFSGSRSGADTAASTCLVMQYDIARRYRGGKPKSFLPLGTATDITTARQWVSSFTSAALTGWNNFITAVVAAGAGCTITNQVNVSYFSGFTNVPYGSPTKYRRVPTLRSGGPVTDAIISTVASPIPGSQRRRNRL